MAFAESFDSTPFNTDNAAEPAPGSDRRLNVATTSFAVIGWPSWNFTFGRSLKVHTSPFAFDDHDSASAGLSVRCSLSSSIRNSPV
jgi:hypothetical protein